MSKDAKRYRARKQKRKADESVPDILTNKEILKCVGMRVRISEDCQHEFFRGKEGKIDIQTKGEQDDDEYRHGLWYDTGVCFMIPAKDFILLDKFKPKQ